MLFQPKRKKIAPRWNIVLQHLAPYKRTLEISAFHHLTEGEAKAIPRLSQLSATSGRGDVDPHIF